jgi:hypothetical protein
VGPCNRQGPKCPYAGFEAIVDHHFAGCVDGDDGFVEAEIIGIGAAACGDENVRAGNSGGCSGAFISEFDSAAFALDAFCFRAKNEADAFGFECFLEFGGNFRILAGNNLRAVVKDGDAAAVAAEHLAEFEADVTTTEHEQVLRHSCELHDAFVGEIGDGLEAGDLRNRGTTAGIDEDFVAFEQVVADSDLMRRDEPAMTAIEAQSRALLDLVFLAAAKAEYDGVFLRDDLRKVDADVAGVDAPSRGVASVAGNLCAVDHGLCWRAADVERVSPETF